SSPTGVTTMVESSTVTVTSMEPLSGGPPGATWEGYIRRPRTARDRPVMDTATGRDHTEPALSPPGPPRPWKVGPLNTFPDGADEVLAAFPDPVAVVDDDFVVQFANPAADRFFGVEPGGLV